MKKATRLLILTAFVFPLFITARAYAGGPRPGPRISHGTDPLYNPLHLEDPVGNPANDIDRNDLYGRAADHRDYDRPPVCDPNDHGGGNAPIDGGIGLLLVAGIGLGIKKARARKQTV
jgi:hypothetical protein